MEITDLRPDDWDAIHQAAALLVAAFREHWPTAWPDMKSALREVRESFGEGRVSRIAVEDGVVLGWVGGIPGYGGNVWEVHPLVVHPHHQGRGIGRALLADLEALAAERGALTLWVGTDDEDGMTSLAGVDLYDDLLGHLARIRNLRGHPLRVLPEGRLRHRGGRARRQRPRQARHPHGEACAPARRPCAGRAQRSSGGRRRAPAGS